jgi:hypothetical protein
MPKQHSPVKREVRKMFGIEGGGVFFVIIYVYLPKRAVAQQTPARRRRLIRLP